MRKWREDLNKRVGESIFLGAQKDYVTGELSGKSALTWLAYVISAIILATPIAMILGGLAIGIWGFPSIFSLFLMALLVAAGWWLLPRAYKLPQNALRRADLPQTFAMTDQIGKVLGAPPITAIVIDESFNAAVVQNRRDTVLILGAILWESLDGAERIALIRHEMAHLVNNDPSKGAFVGAALQTIEGWSELVQPSRIIDPFEEENFIRGANLIGDIITATLGTLIDGVWSLLERLNYPPQQRAEYLADALSAEVAGSAAPASLLEHLEMAPRIRRAAGGLSSRNPPGGLEMIQRLAKATRDVPDAERNELLDDMRQSGHSINETHPPTVFRLAFLRTLPKQMAKITPDDISCAAVDAELSPHFARLGDKISSRLIVQ